MKQGALVDLVICFFLGAMTGMLFHALAILPPEKTKWQLEAISAGVAEYRINPKTFEKEFKWKGRE